MPAQRKFGPAQNITATVEPGEEGRMDCRVEHRSGFKTFSASLAALEATGVLEDHDGNALVIKPEVIDEIGAWATAVGY